MGEKEMKTIKLECRVYGRANEADHDSFFSESEEFSVDCIDSMDSDTIVFLQSQAYSLLTTEVSKWHKTKEELNEK